MQFCNLIDQIEEITEINKVTYFVKGLKSAICMEVVY